MLGRATNIVTEKGYFFLRAEHDQSVVDYFAHRSALRGIRIHQVQEGDLFEFRPTDTERGLRAEEIRRVSESATESVTS